VVLKNLDHFRALGITPSELFHMERYTYFISKTDLRSLANLGFETKFKLKSVNVLPGGSSNQGIQLEFHIVDFEFKFIGLSMSSNKSMTRCNEQASIYRSTIDSATVMQTQQPVDRSTSPQRALRTIFTTRTMMMQGLRSVVGYDGDLASQLSVNGCLFEPFLAQCHQR
jgi:hypothetical protein